MSNARDPRHDPQPGDKLQRGRDVWTVVELGKAPVAKWTGDPAHSEVVPYVVCLRDGRGDQSERNEMPLAIGNINWRKLMSSAILIDSKEMQSAN